MTKHGRPVAKLVAYSEPSPPLFGSLAGSIAIRGDIVAPVDVVWDAESSDR